jgi:hypothetical protein
MKETAGEECRIFIDCPTFSRSCGVVVVLVSENGKILVKFW